MLRCATCGFPLMQEHTPPFQCANPTHPHYNDHGPYGLVRSEPPAPAAVEPEPEPEAAEETQMTEEEEQTDAKPPKQRR